MKINYLKDGKPVWKSSIGWEKATKKQREEANLRTIQPPEIILDADMHGNDKDRELSAVIAELIRDNYRFKAYVHRKNDSGSARLYFPEMIRFDLKKRNFIRGLFIKRYQCDMNKKSERTYISREGALHWKTGRIETLVADYPGVNVLPEWILKELENTNFDTIPESTGLVTPSWVKNDPVIQYCLQNVIPDGTGRYGTLVKNLGIALGLTGASDSELKPILAQLSENMPGRSENDFMGWIHASRQGRYKNYNRRELIKWFEDNEVSLNG